VSFYGDDAFVGGSFDDGVPYTLGARVSFSAARTVTHIRWWVPPDAPIPTAAAIHRDGDHTPIATGGSGRVIVDRVAGGALSFRQVGDHREVI
jgi:hypothetical protein